MDDNIFLLVQNWEDGRKTNNYTHYFSSIFFKSKAKKKIYDNE